MKEIWKNIPDYDRYYKASNLGRIKSLKRTCLYSDRINLRTVNERILKQSRDKNCYPIVGLSKEGKVKQIPVHQLVAMCFHGYIRNGLNDYVVNHIDFNKENNIVTNLEIITNRENSNKKHIKSTSEYVGVHWHKATKKWQASISIKRKM